MLNKLTKEKIAIVFYLAIGSFGAIGQALLVSGDLDHDYPYKMMSFADFYTSVGKIGLFVAPTIAIALTFLFFSTKRYLIPAIPVFVCPLVFLLVFELMAWNTKFDANEIIAPQFDENTWATVHFYFIKSMISLSGVGAIIGIICGAILFAFEKLIFSAFKKSLR